MQQTYIYNLFHLQLNHSHSLLRAKCVLCSFHRNIVSRAHGCYVSRCDVLQQEYAVEQFQMRSAKQSRVCCFQIIFPCINIYMQHYYVHEYITRVYVFTVLLGGKTIGSDRCCPSWALQKRPTTKELYVFIWKQKKFV